MIEWSTLILHYSKMSLYHPTSNDCQSRIVVQKPCYTFFLFYLCVYVVASIAQTLKKNYSCDITIDRGESRPQNLRCLLHERGIWDVPFGIALCLVYGDQIFILGVVGLLILVASSIQSSRASPVFQELYRYLIDDFLI